MCRRQRRVISFHYHIMMPHWIQMYWWSWCINLCSVGGVCIKKGYPFTFRLQTCLPLNTNWLSWKAVDQKAPCKVEFYHRSEYEKLSWSMYSTIVLIPPHWQLPQVCLFHLSLQTAMTANFDIKPRSQDTRLRKYYSITSRIDVWDFSKSFSDTLINWYKYRTLFTDTIAADSYNILMIAILKH